MMADRGVTVSHSTILRWVQRYVPEFEKRWERYERPVHSSWRMDETAISVRGGNRYLYRAIDKYGKTVESLLCVDRSISAAREFFGKAMRAHHGCRPRKVNLDGNAATHSALRLLRQEEPEWRSVKVRSCRYLNNIVGARGQAPLRTDALLQVISHGRDYARRGGTSAPYLQAPVHFVSKRTLLYIGLILAKPSARPPGKGILVAHQTSTGS
jgi:transposase-like protein